MLEAIAHELAQRASIVEVRKDEVARGQLSVPYKPLTAKCLLEESKRNSIQLIQLLGVLKTEDGRVGMMKKNTDSSYDLGPMQINTVHVPELVKIYGVPAQTITSLIANDGCFNVAIGAWLLRKRSNEVGGDFWLGIGRYHSKTPRYSTRYILSVHSNINEIISNSK
ncbi:lytic transglycosylase domain-containing protein [Acidovorax carolinensis]|uniref:lytic transglycosylase domain-containing protein n=1 Tax=Acidovorax carolinensis TaxID=553814 RepID=UPI0012FF91D2|nr:lytic transglycosylase domain-containing protein [Acidovorax carolinensis]